MKSCKSLSDNKTYLKSENYKNVVAKPLLKTNDHIRKCTVKNLKKYTKKKRRKDYLKCICWFLVPLLTIILVLLDALNIYSFNKERLTVIEIGVLVILLPFFSEITLKNLSVKRNKTQNDKDD